MAVCRVRSGFAHLFCATLSEHVVVPDNVSVVGLNVTQAAQVANLIDLRRNEQVFFNPRREL